ncbi:MAG: hypothetical protein MUC50_13220 [Myxococcota bacterium]|jgi:hypothetical protein|nr:hypothetical protein [Myxococcota bacterium]
MGFMDKLKGAVNAVTGGAAKVGIEMESPWVPCGGPLRVEVTATSTGPELKSKGIYIDVWAQETVKYHDSENHEQTITVTTFEQSYQINPETVIPASGSQSWKGEVMLPQEIYPTYEGKNAKNQWYVRGRVDATGNDPDSGFQPFNVYRAPR